MYVDEMLTILRQDEDKQLKLVISNPHSNRGYYEKLAFVISEGSMPVKDAIALVESCIGQTYQGYKGGNFMMNRWSEVVFVTYMYESDDCSGTLLLRLLMEVK